MNALIMALSEQNRLPKVSFVVFINTSMALLLNRRSFPVAERTQIRWRTTWAIEVSDGTLHWLPVSISVLVASSEWGGERGGLENCQLLSH